jgi:FixJ family two-component response regulator
MNRRVILVLDADADTARAVASAAAGVNCDIRFVQTSKDFFHFCHEDFENVAAIILDVDPGIHGMAILEAFDACENMPPIIVVSALEEHRLSSVVQQHGAIACLGKPLSLARLRHAVEEALTIAAAAAPRCDVWGHVKACGGICTRKNGIRQEKLTNQKYGIRYRV